MEELELINMQLLNLAEEQDSIATEYRRNTNARAALDEHLVQRNRLFKELSETFPQGEMRIVVGEINHETRRYQQQLQDELLESEHQLKREKCTLEARETELYDRRRKAAEETK
ncbi:Uncharacterised protein [Listeria grayi]|uniref:Uncharacterized protein n=1 Tax=Listeria grayi FSL F6-1183 TaxID=1265827 RepID=A0A829R403_LISGR|nr:DUF3958 family protein [Listeria grayi]EUJ26004.1 hypothetical protein LMUR_13969 [Listeria grayi FSL F6-1183]VEI36532.1 Uncharacterised protein [Listeria grayi]